MPEKIPQARASTSGLLFVVLALCFFEGILKSAGINFE